MIVYCIICYFVILGMLLQDKEQTGKLYVNAFITFLAAPFLLPLIIGMKIEEHNKKEK